VNVDVGMLNRSLAGNDFTKSAKLGAFVRGARGESSGRSETGGSLGVYCIFGGVDFEF